MHTCAHMHTHTHTTYMHTPTYPHSLPQVHHQDGLLDASTIIKVADYIILAVLVVVAVVVVMVMMTVVLVTIVLMLALIHIHYIHQEPDGREVSTVCCSYGVHHLE